MLLAKSSDANKHPETLLDHSLNVLAMARQLYQRLPCGVRSREWLLPDLEAAALVHDIGKAAVGFQERLEGKRPYWNGWRHELLSAGFASNLHVSEAVIFAVLTHHRQIPGSPKGDSHGRLHWTGKVPGDWLRMIEEWQVNQETALALWDSLCDRAARPDLKSGSHEPVQNILLEPAWLDRFPIRQNKTISPGRRMDASLLRGLVIGADHLASGGITALPPPLDLTLFSPKFEFRNFQRKCSVNGNVILDAPTGSGKTEAALIWAAANLQENGRFFYTLPYTAALNAMHRRFERDFPGQSESIGLLHGRAVHHLYEAAQQDYPSDPEKATQEAKGRTRLAKETFYPARICTPHQLLRFTLRGKGWEQMLSEIPGSCIVFDEVHSYDAKLAGLTLGTARLFESMGAKLMFISATLPDFLRAHISRLAPMITISPDPNDASDREVLDRKRHIVTLVDGHLLSRVNQIAEGAEAGRHVLVVCNHVGSAQTVARALRSLLGNDEDQVCLFHGRFHMKDRKTKEATLASKKLPQVLVATQVVEVSLDVSFDQGFFEAAPIDALVQRMGRVNRQGKVPAPVFIFRSALNRHAIYESRHTQKTIDLLADMHDPLSELDLKRLCNEVYIDGYVGEEKRVFEDRLNHSFLSRFEDEMVAGEHLDWIDTVIESTEGRADLLPAELKPAYDNFIRQKLWLSADALLVNAYTSNLAPYLDKTTDPWIVNLKYDHEGLHTTTG